MSIISTVPKGAAVEGINPNLLRNWYFVGGGTGRGVFPVNSRGQTSYIGTNTNTFAIDNWYNYWTSATITVESDSLYLESTAVSENGVLSQILPNELIGKTVTASILYKDSTGSFKFQGDNTVFSAASGLASVTYVVESAIFSIRTTGTSHLRVIAAKLELGDQQTLAHQENGVWVLNEIPEYEEEYYRCITSDLQSTDTYANQKVSNITVQCNSVGSSSLRYYNKLIQSTHKVLDSTFSNPAAQTSDITVTTYDGYLDFSNGFASGATTNITLVLGTSGPVLSTTTTAPS